MNKLMVRGWMVWNNWMMKAREVMEDESGMGVIEIAIIIIVLIAIALMFRKQITEVVDGLLKQINVDQVTVDVNNG